jgi:hypothetical protein
MIGLLLVNHLDALCSGASACAELEEFLGDEKPPYAILSHTWGKEEVLFADMKDFDCNSKSPIRFKDGSRKIESSAQQARLDGHDYIWIDTCCIDKTSSAELSEAINSMYRWYAEAAVCYAHLNDVPDLSDPLPEQCTLGRSSQHRCEEMLTDQEEDALMQSAFARSRWFKRGWTLQELMHHESWNFIVAIPNILSQEKTYLLL